MLSLFKKSLNKLMVYSEDKLKKEYEREEQRIQSEHVQKEEEEKKIRSYELTELVQRLDVLQQSTPTQEQFNIDELIAKIDARIAELEREEKNRGNRITQFGEMLRNITHQKNEINDLSRCEENQTSTWRSLQGNRYIYSMDYQVDAETRFFYKIQPYLYSNVTQ